MEWRKVAAENARYIKLIKTDAVIGDAILRSVIGADLLAAIAAANQRLARL